jgi:hypothetical protein
VDLTQHLADRQVGEDDHEGHGAPVRGRGGEEVAQRLQQRPEAAVAQVEALGEAGLGEGVDLPVELQLGLGGHGGGKRVHRPS